MTLDNLVVSTALPTIRRDLHASLQSLEWTVNAYTLTFAVLLLTGAALSATEVARELERRWEEALQEVRRLEEEYARFRQTQPTTLASHENIGAGLNKALGAILLAPNESTTACRSFSASA